MRNMYNMVGLLYIWELAGRINLSGDVIMTAASLIVNFIFSVTTIHGTYFVLINEDKFVYLFH